MSVSATVYCGDCFEILPQLIHERVKVDCIFADPPYFLSGKGTTNSGGKRVLVDKGNWDKPLTVEEKLTFNKHWISLCKELLTDTGTIWVSGTLHNIFSVGEALEELGFYIINNITWQKTNPPPNLACRCFTHSTETILWAKKSKKAKHCFNYNLMKEQNGGKQHKDVWTGALTPLKEKKLGKHPTQKPMYLLNKIIQASTMVGNTILDPFCGSGTTGVAATSLNRSFIGIEQDPDYVNLSKTRIEEAGCFVQIVGEQGEDNNKK